MIDPNTLPGTKIVCVDKTCRAEYIKPNPYFKLGGEAVDFKLGKVYTLAEIQVVLWTRDGYVAVTCEIPNQGLPLPCWDYLTNHEDPTILKIEEVA